VSELPVTFKRTINSEDTSFAYRKFVLVSELYETIVPSLVVDVVDFERTHTARLKVWLNRSFNNSRKERRPSNQTPRLYTGCGANVLVAVISSLSQCVEILSNRSSVYVGASSGY
jgi:hypothetical protein